MLLSKDWKTKWRLNNGRPIRSLPIMSLMGPKAAIFFFALFLAVSVGITGCASRMVIENVALPYGTVKQTVLNNFPGGVRTQSSNGREVASNYFSVEKNGAFRALGSDESTTIGDRAYAEVVILGERRPYRLDVRVYRQKRDRAARKYSSPVYDKGLTDTFSQMLKDSLANRREDRNVIDDFRAF